MTRMSQPAAVRENAAWAKAVDLRAAPTTEGRPVAPNSSKELCAVAQQGRRPIGVHGGFEPKYDATASSDREDGAIGRSCDMVESLLSHDETSRSPRGAARHCNG